MSPKVIVISLDGATDSIVDRYLANGILDSKTGLGLLKSKGVAATDNETVTPSLTASSHIAIATGSSAVNNDINANSFHLITNPFNTNTSGFAAPVGGYIYQSGIDPSESTNPTANPLWLTLQAAGKKVVAATFPGADGATIRSSTGIVLDKKEDRTVSYTVPFGEFGGQGARGFNLTAADFGTAAQTTLDQLQAIGKTSFSPVLQTKTPIDSFTIGGIKFDFQVAALDTTNDSKVNYDSVVIFDAAQGIKAAPATLPSTGSAFLKAGDTASQPFYLEGTPNKVGTGFFLANLATDLSTVRIARYSANDIPRPADNPGVVANVDDINNNVGFWKPQPDFRIPERISPGFGPFTDPELEAIYADQVKSFVEYQTNIAIRAIQQNNNSDLVLTYLEQPDGSQHQFLITDPRQATDFTNPNSIGAGQDTDKIARYQRYIETAYQTANSAVQRIIDTVGVDANGKPNSNIIVVSDHGFAPFHTAVSLNNLLRNAGFDSSKVRAVTSGPAVNVYINLKGREPNGVVEVAEYLTLQKQVLDTFKGFVDTNTNYVIGAASNPIFDKVYNRAVPASAITANDVINARGEFIGQDTGDVFALLKTGYNFDGTQAIPVIRKGDTTSASPVFSVPNFYGAHGYDPTLAEMKAIFYAAGPDIDQKQLGSVRNIDVAPTIEKILGVKPADTVDGTAIALGSSTVVDLPAQPKITNYDFTNLPKLGTASNGQDIFLGGFSGLYFQGLAANGNLKFVTNTDRGPNGEPTGANRPFLLPSFQPEIVSFELNRQTGKIDITKRTGLFRADGTTPLTGLPNLQAQANGLAYTDEVGVDLAGKVLPNDPFGADVEGIVVAANGDYWLVDEYRPAIYHFDINGKLLDRFIPKGTAVATEPDSAPGTFGTEVLPEVYAQRRSNRGFEAVALDGDKLYAFIQSPIDNPDNGGDTASRASRNLRILEFNTVSKTVTGEYVYLLDNITGSGNAKTDKLGDAVALGNGKFALVERDDLATTASNKLIYQIDLAGATNINNPANFTLPAGKTIEQLTATELTTAKITPVSKSLIANAAQLGYTGVEKLEGLALVAPNTLALINDNDFNVAGGNVPERLGILELAKDLPVAKPAFPNGIASGDTTQDSTVLWTRANALGNVTFEYSTKADFSSIAGTKTATVTNALQPVKVNVDGLTANTDYFYRVTDANGAKLNGKFSTAAALGNRTGLKFGVTGDWRGELAPYPSIGNADTANLKFFIELGDTIYGDVASPAVRNPDGSEKSQATTLADYRAKQAEVYSSRFGQNTFGDLRATTSILATIDDHEVTNDFSGGENLATASAAAQTLYGATTGLVNDSPLYENGLQAFQEFNPIKDLTYSTPTDARTDGERKLYRANTFGSDAATFILDTRSFRDTELPGVTNPADRAQVGKFLVDSFDPKRTLLGKQQIEDLKKDLLKSQQDGVTWKFITVPEPIQNIGVLAASDRFEGYAAERTEILKFINDNKISNVVFVAADIHGTLVNNLTYQTAPGQAQIATSAFEITTGSVGYSEPFGQTVARLGAALGVITPAQKAFYDSLPTAGKDTFIKGVVDGGLNPLGYDPLGLDKNLTQANGLINAKLLQGDYVATHVYGWTEFNIDQKTQKLTVTTYGIDPYTRAELEANPAAITSRQPKIVSQFEVVPSAIDLEQPVVLGTTGADKLEAGITPGFDGKNNVVFAGAGNDTVDVPIAGTGAGNNRIDTGSGNDVIFIADADRLFGSLGDDEFEATDAKDYRASGGAGNDTFFLGTNGRALGGEGNDKFFVGAGGGNLLSGGAGTDQFWLANGDIPAAANTILDFQIGTDVVGIQGIGANASNIVLSQIGADTSIGFSGQTLALLKGIQASSLTLGNPGQFVFA